MGSYEILGLGFFIVVMLVILTSMVVKFGNFRK